MLLTDDMTLLLSGTQQDLDTYDQQIRTAPGPPVTAIVIGGGRVGRATSRSLTLTGIEHQVVEKASDQMVLTSRYVIGDALNHDDDINVYLTLYCRRQGPDLQILRRATLQHNVSTLRRAGAELVLVGKHDDERRFFERYG